MLLNDKAGHFRYFSNQLLPVSRNSNYQIFPARAGKSTVNVPGPFDIVFAVVDVNTVTAIFRSSGRDLFYLRRFTALVAKPSQSLRGECHERRWILAK